MNRFLWVGLGGALGSMMRYGLGGLVFRMKGGSTLVSFEFAGGKAAAFRFLNGLSIIKLSNNLGDAKSLITHPATTTHQRLKPDVRAELGISDGLVRLSAGLEAPGDLIADIDHGIAALKV